MSFQDTSKFNAGFADDACLCGWPDLPGQCPGADHCPMHGENEPPEEKTMTLAQDEENFCNCGAGHGSLEGHVEWCVWLKLEPRLAASFAAAELLRTPALHRIRVTGTMMDREEVAAALLPKDGTP